MPVDQLIIAGRVVLPVTQIDPVTGLPITSNTVADPAESTTVTIANGQSLSPAIDLGAGKRLARIAIPAAWTTANLTFQTSVDGTNFFDFYDQFGNEKTVIVGGVSRAILLDFADWIGVRYCKIRSGTTGTPVAQGGARILTLALVK